MSEPAADESLSALPEALEDESPVPGAADEEEALAEADGEEGSDDEGPVHRRLIRATLPRPEGQAPERKAPDFTMRNGRFDQRNGQRPRGRQARQAGQSFGQPARQNNQRHGSGRPGGNDAGGQRS